MTDTVHTQPLETPKDSLLRRIETLAMEAMQIARGRYEELTKVIYKEGLDEFDASLTGLMVLKIAEISTLKAFEEGLGLTIDECMTVKECCDSAIYYLLRAAGGLSKEEITRMTKGTDISDIIEKCAPSRVEDGKIRPEDVAEAMTTYNESINNILAGNGLRGM